MKYVKRKQLRCEMIIKKKTSFLHCQLYDAIHKHTTTTQKTEYIVPEYFLGPESQIKLFQCDINNGKQLRQ